MCVGVNCETRSRYARVGEGGGKDIGGCEKRGEKASKKGEQEKTQYKWCVVL